MEKINWSLFVFMSFLVIIIGYNLGQSYQDIVGMDNEYKLSSVKIEYKDLNEEKKEIKKQEPGATCKNSFCQFPAVGCQECCHDWLGDHCIWKCQPDTACAYDENGCGTLSEPCTP